VIWRQVIRPVIHWGKRIETAVGFVEHEMRENSGKSMRDAVNRIDHRVEKVEQRVAELAPQIITVVTQGDTSGQT
jgi:archaellum component FlaC